jgi:hypothetical protein
LLLCPRYVLYCTGNTIRFGSVLTMFFYFECFLVVRKDRGHRAGQTRYAKLLVTNCNQTINAKTEIGIIQPNFIDKFSSVARGPYRKVSIHCGFFLSSFSRKNTPYLWLHSQKFCTWILLPKIWLWTCYCGLSNSQDFQTKWNYFIMKEVKLYAIQIHLHYFFH